MGNSEICIPKSGPSVNALCPWEIRGKRSPPRVPLVHPGQKATQVQGERLESKVSLTPEALLRPTWSDLHTSGKQTF